MSIRVDYSKVTAFENFKGYDKLMQVWGEINQPVS